MDDFNRLYSIVLEHLDDTFNGCPDRLEAAIHAMFELKAVADALMVLPLDGGAETAGPSFEYVPPEER